MTETAPPAPPVPPGTQPELANHVIPPIAGFWRRMTAFVLDGLILGLIGQAIAWPLSTLWFQFGPYGRVIGQLVALAYFAVLDSRKSNGQTPGKRVLGVAVRNRDGEAIGVGRAAVRTLVWLIPVTLNGWELPILTNPVVMWISGVIVFGLGAAVLVTMAFNKRTRQGLHDMLTDTYVLRLAGTPVEALPVAARLQWILSGAMAMLAIALASMTGVVAAKMGAPMQDMARLQEQLVQDERFFSASVYDKTFYGRGDTTPSNVLDIQVWYRGTPSGSDRRLVLNDIAEVALKTPNVGRYELIRIDVKSAFDLGFATGYVAYGDGQPVSVWRERTEQASE